jgi:hypothetical protein
MINVINDKNIYQNEYNKINKNEYNKNEYTIKTYIK